MQECVAFFIKLNQMKNLIEKMPLIWNVTCGVSTLVSLGLLVFGDKNAVIIGLSVFCIALLAIVFFIVKGIRDFTKNMNEEDHIRIYTDIKYCTEDSNSIEYEVYKTVQSKKYILDGIVHKYKWSGNQKPVITSKLQTITSKKEFADPDEYDEVFLKFDTPLFYNDVGVIHFNCEINDSDHSSDTFVACKITSYSELLHFRIILKYKPKGYNKPAYLYRRKLIVKTQPVEERLEPIPFDNSSKSYEYIKERPDIGYCYILRWER